MAPTFSPKEIARLAGVSVATVRGYSNRPELAELFSPGARPGPGQAREFTEQDLKLIRLISELTAQGQTYGGAADTIRIMLGSGEFERWEPEERDAAGVPGADWDPSERLTGAASTDLTTGGQVGDLVAILDRIAEGNAQGRQVIEELRGAWAADRARADQLAEEVRAVEETYQEKIAELERALGQAQGRIEEAQAARERRPAWVKWLFGQ